MKTVSVKVVLFGLMALVQLAVPVTMIVQAETNLTAGVLMKFRMAPVDPYDPFRGRYVTLSFEDNTVADTTPRLKSGESVYVRCEVGEDGYARPAEASRKPFETGPYFQGRVWRGDREKVHVDFPFDRYYMKEQEAKDAERVQRVAAARWTADGRRQAPRLEGYAEVRVGAGRANVVGLYYEGHRIEDFVRGKVKLEDVLRQKEERAAAAKQKEATK